MADPAGPSSSLPGSTHTGTEPSGNLGVDDVRYRRGDNAVLRSALIEQWNARCYWCEQPTRFTDTQIDHIIPHTVTPDELRDLIQWHGLPAEFDVHAPANLAPICSTCNRKKSDRKLRAPAVTTQLDQAREKQQRLIAYVRAAARSRKGWSDAVIADLQLTTDAEALARMRLIAERAQSFSEVWQIGFYTGPDGAAVHYTPKPEVAADDIDLPLLFDLPATDDAMRIAHQLDEIRDYGGEVIVPARYLRASPDSSKPSLAEALGPFGPEDELVITAGLAPIDRSNIYQLVLVTAARTLRQSLALHPQRVTVGRRGLRVTLRDASGVFGVFVQIEHPPPVTTITTQLISQSLVGRHPYQLREFRTFFQLAEPTDQLEIRLNDQSIGTHADTDDPVDLGPALMAFRHDTAII
ncbi:HNH endonuclease, partial [Paractinoplanes tereljensis]